MKLKLLQYLYLWFKSKLTSRVFLVVVLKPFLHWHIKKRDADFHHFETSVDAIKNPKSTRNIFIINSITFSYLSEE